MAQPRGGTTAAARRPVLRVATGHSRCPRCVEARGAAVAAGHGRGARALRLPQERLAPRRTPPRAAHLQRARRRAPGAWRQPAPPLHVRGLAYRRAAAAPREVDPPPPPHPRRAESGGRHGGGCGGPRLPAGAAPRDLLRLSALARADARGGGVVPPVAAAHGAAPAPAGRRVPRHGQPHHRRRRLCEQRLLPLPFGQAGDLRGQSDEGAGEATRRGPPPPPPRLHPISTQPPPRLHPASTPPPPRLLPASACRPTACSPRRCTASAGTTRSTSA